MVGAQGRRGQSSVSVHGSAATGGDEGAYAGAGCERRRDFAAVLRAVAAGGLRGVESRLRRVLVVKETFGTEIAVARLFIM